jgi:hypothetical protein
VNYHQNHVRNLAELDVSFRSNTRIFMEKHRGLEPALFFLHAKGILSLSAAAQMAQDLASVKDTVLARELGALLRTSLQWLPDAPR